MGGVGAAWRRDGALREGSLWPCVCVCGGVSLGVVVASLWVLWWRCGGAVALLWWRCEAVGAVPVRCVSLRLRQAAPPPSEEEEFPLDCGEALGQVKDCVGLVAASLEYLVHCFEKRCNYAALR